MTRIHQTLHRVVLRSMNSDERAQLSSFVERVGEKEGTGQACCNAVKLACQKYLLRRDTPSKESKGKSKRRVPSKQPLTIRGDCGNGKQGRYNRQRREALG